MKLYKTMPSPIGDLAIACENGLITNLEFDTTIEAAVPGEAPILDVAENQLNEYFAGTRRDFDLLLFMDGTDFQVSVWQALLDIPWGTVRTYGEIAAKIGRPLAPRAVGMANNKNRIPIIIPCHRVIGANGKLVGYGGGLPIKEFLLALEHTD